jgi:preprotein translocase subunit SecD
MNLKRTKWTFLAIVVLTVIAAVLAIPKGPDLNLKPLGINYKQEIKIHEGLDLRGGSSLVYEADMSKVPDGDRKQALEGAVDVINKRVNGLGVSEPVVQSSNVAGSYRVIVELPGVTDINDASKTIGQTVNMEFREQNPNPDPTSTDPLAAFLPTSDLTGKDFKRATVTFNQQTSEPEISIQFNSDGAKKFADITRRNIGKPVAIILDGQVISAPRVQSEITDGNAVITGQFTVDEAKKLALQLNAGALPVPVKLVEQRTVGPTLGQDSIERSLTAGVIGLALVALFMIYFYRLPGVLAVGALLVYSLLMIALFKFIPVTLTLAGIAGFILSIGIAVDANILIFERMKEELREGRPLGNAIEVGFARAFTSIRDSNMASLLMSAVLWVFGSGTIKGFALVLALGVGVSIFSAITVSRTFIRLVARTRLGKNLRLWGLSKQEAQNVA